MSAHRKLNIERIKVLIEEVREAADNLLEYAKLPEDEILSNKTVLNAVKYSFIVAIQGIINICHHIVARLSGKVPDEYGECFLILKEMGYLTSDYALKLKSMAGFRNILIHLYHEVDDRRVLKYLKKDLWIIEEFLKVTKKVLDENI